MKTAQLTLLILCEKQHSAIEMLLSFEILVHNWKS